MTDLYYATLLVFSGFVSLVVAGTAWRRRPMPGAGALAVMMFAMCAWSCLYAVFWLVPSRQDKLIWLGLAYLGVLVVPAAFLVMSAQFTGHTRWLTRRLYLVLVIPALVVLFSLWTDPWFSYFFGNVNFTDPEYYLKGGPGFWLGVAYSYLLSFVAALFLIQAFIRSSTVRREQIGLMLMGSSFPVIINLLGFLHLSPLHGLDLTPFVFSVSGVLYAYGIFSYRLVDLVPVGREAVVEIMEESVLVIDRQNKVVDLNPQAKKFLDSGVNSPVGRPVELVFSTWLKDSLLDLSIPQARFQVKVTQSAWRYYDITITPLADRAGLALGRLIIWRDITTQKKIEAEFQKFYLAVEQSNASIVITDTASRIEYANPFFSQITGYDLESVRGLTPQIFKSGLTSDEVYKSLWQAISSGKEWGGEMLNKKKNGELFWEYNRISPVTDSNGNITHYLAIKEDITERKEKDEQLREANAHLKSQLSEIESLHAQLKEESIRDALTGLYNRKFMEETLEREISMAMRTGSVLSLVIIDVDKFKTVNDRFGHQAGDTVIQTLGEFLRQNTRSGDIACRYGGDEVVVVMPNATLNAAFQRAEEWRVAFLGMEFVFDSQHFSTSLSLGVAAFPLQVANSFALMNAADKALYAAKIGRNMVCRYDPDTMTSEHPRSPQR
jgi:diguanylate cyclase (GGDEF)-like protein/PAS domain S-box-containing protein